MNKSNYFKHFNRRDALGIISGAFGALATAPATAQGTPPAASVPAKGQDSPIRTFTASPLKRRLRTDLPLERAPELEMWAFDGVSPGPVLRLRHGEELRLKVENRIERPLSLHWHGVRNLSAMDGVGGFSQAPIMPGESFEYRFTPPDPGVYMYRPLVIGGSSELAERGLCGLLVIEEKTPPSVDHDLAVLVDDWLLLDDGKLAPFAAQAPEGAAYGRLGSWMTANGRSLPERLAVRPGARVRLRLANGASARILRLRFDGVKANVLAVDGQPTDTFEPLRGTLPFPPGSRYDVMIDMPETEGAVANVMTLIGSGLSLVRIAVEGKPLRLPGTAAADILPLPPNPLLPAGIRLQDAVRTEMIIEGGAKITPDNRFDLSGVNLARPWTVNGSAGDPASKPLFVARRGQPVVLALDNRTAFAQPIHIHGHASRLLHPMDDGWEPYFLDTLQLPENRKLHISFQADNPGRWLISSSVLDRFDAGLWTWFEVR